MTVQELYGLAACYAAHERSRSARNGHLKCFLNCSGARLKEILQNLGAHIRSLGFKGSGRNFRRIDDDYIFFINVQGSRSGDGFYVNLGAQPTFIPAECNAPLSTLKEYECVMRRRVGKEWKWAMDDRMRFALMHQLDVEQKAFFGAVGNLSSAITHDSVDEMLRRFSMGSPPARTALHLARAAAFLGHTAVANALVTRGLALAGEHATGLIHELRLVGQAIHAG